MSKLSEKRIYWSDVVARYKKSNLTQRAFCESENLNLSVFQYWTHKLKQSTPPVVASKSFSQIALTRRTASNEYQIKLPSGLTCHVPFGFDVLELKNLLGVLVQC